jgi:hypothetical protein
MCGPGRGVLQDEAVWKRRLTLALVLAGRSRHKVQNSGQHLQPYASLNSYDAGHDVRPMLAVHTLRALLRAPERQAMHRRLGCDACTSLQVSWPRSRRRASLGPSSLT